LQVNLKAKLTNNLLEVTMKKLLVTMLAVLSCGATYALPLGNPSEASLLCDGVFWEGHCGDLCDPCLTWCDAFSVRLGFYGDYVFNRYMEADATSNNRDLDSAQVYTNAAYLAANFWDRVDIWGTLGATNLTFSGDLGLLNPAAGVETGDNVFELTGVEDFSWSIGARATLWECGCTALGVEFQWFSTRQDVDKLTIYDNFGGVKRETFASDRNLKVQYTDWQIGLGVSHRINMLVPYIGVTWGTAQAKFGSAAPSFGVDSVDLNNFESVKTWGFAVGTSLVDCEKMALTVEVDLAREAAAYVNGQFRF
jgi:major outer membrane protein